MLYVKMTDDLLSGWGPAEGKLAILCVRCKNAAEAAQVTKAARRRPEMRNIKQQLQPAKTTEVARVTLLDFNELHGDWLL